MRFAWLCAKAKPSQVFRDYGELILNEEPCGGTHRLAAEIGHMVLDVNGPKCGCGSEGCFEALASRTALFQRIQEAVKRGEKHFEHRTVHGFQNLTAMNLSMVGRRCCAAASIENRRRGNAAIPGSWRAPGFASA
ncbi:MAG: ROK family protein [Verrucomicrobia bacterium]|nr:ROK family protein [Verrucomicrobiota bacterium]